MKKTCLLSEKSNFCLYRKGKEEPVGKKGKVKLVNDDGIGDGFIMLNE